MVVTEITIISEAREDHSEEKEDAVAMYEKIDQSEADIT